MIALKSLAIEESGNINLNIWYNDLPIERQDGALQGNMQRVLLHGLQTPLLLAQSRTVEAVPHIIFF